MTFRFFVTGRSISCQAIALMEEHSCQARFWPEGDDGRTLAECVRHFQPHGLVVRKGKITREVLNASTRLKAVCKHGVGVDNIDLAAATELGVPVMIASWANYESVAELTLGLILSLVRSIHQQHAYTMRGGWDKSDYQGTELLGRTLGLVGFGRIGSRVCELVEPLRMRVLVYDPYLAPGQLPSHVERVSELHAMLPLVDVLSIHAPLTPETDGLIGEVELDLLGPQACLVNTARGGVVDEEALTRALQGRKIRGAALDTLREEPPEPDNPLFALDNVVVTNHVGGSSTDALLNMGVDAVSNLLDVLIHNQLDPSNVVNPEVLSQRGF